MKAKEEVDIPGIADAYLEGITKIANVLLKKKHPDQSIHRWQVEYIYKADYLFQQEARKKK